MDRVEETAGTICGIACRHFGESSVSHTFREKIAAELRAMLERLREDELRESAATAGRR